MYLYIPKNVCNVESNVNTGEIRNIKSPLPISLLNIKTPIPSNFKTPISSSLPKSPPQVSLIPTTTIIYMSPTFVGILQNPLHDTIFSSQSTDPSNDDVVTLKNMNQLADENDDYFDFGPILFNTYDENVEDDAIIPGRQYKVLNSKLNMILKFVCGPSQAFNPSPFATKESI